MAAHLAGGDGVWLFIVDSPGSGKTEIIRANAITPQVIDTYAPELRAELLPG